MIPQQPMPHTLFVYSGVCRVWIYGSGLLYYYPMFLFYDIKHYYRRTSMLHLFFYILLLSEKVMFWAMWEVQKKPVNWDGQWPADDTTSKYNLSLISDKIFLQNHQLPIFYTCYISVQIYNHKYDKHLHQWQYFT